MSKDYTQLITSEHNQQPNFVATVALTANGIADITALLASLPSEFDIDNAIGAQLDAVGKWIGQGRQVNGVLLVQFFGFADDASALTFGELTNASVGGRFAELSDITQASAILQDPEYRTVLKAKIIANDYAGSIAELEAACADVIGVPCMFIDPGTRVVMIVVTETIDPVIQALLTGYDILPRPAGVRYQLVFPLTGIVWNTTGTASVNGTQITKPTGTGAWDSSAYVIAPSAHMAVSWGVQDTSSFFIGGLAVSPAASPNFATLNFGLVCAGGVVQVFESGVQQGTNFGPYVPGDTFEVYYDGKEAVYIHNNVIFKTTAASPNSFSPMFSLFNVGSVVNNVAIYTG